MHPPPFKIQHRLSDWADCYLEIRCGKRCTYYPVRLLLAEVGDQSFLTVLEKLRCKHCGGRPAPVYLCATPMRTHSFGSTPDWAVELRQGPVLVEEEANRQDWGT